MNRDAGGAAACLPAPARSALRRRSAARTLPRPPAATAERQRLANARRTVAMPGRRSPVPGTGEPPGPPPPPCPSDGWDEARWVVGGGAALVSLVLATLPPAATAPLFEAAEDFARHFFVGGFAAAVGTAVVYPLDVLKTRMQLQPARWPSALACGAEAVREGGLPALYAGMATNLVGVAPEKSLKIMAYTACHSQLLVLLGAPPSAELPFAWEAAAGAAAGAAQAVIACPLEAAKIPMQAAARGAARPRMASVVASLGFSGLFRGFDVCLARDTLTSGLFFAVFAWAKVALAEAAMRAGMDPPIPFVLKLLAGGFAGIPAALLTTPLDVVKTRLQAPEGRDADALQCAMRTVREEGAWALWCGAGERVARLSPQLGISLALYEILEGLE